MQGATNRSPRVQGLGVLSGGRQHLPAAGSSPPPAVSPLCRSSLSFGEKLPSLQPRCNRHFINTCSSVGFRGLQLQCCVPNAAICCACTAKFYGTSDLIRCPLSAVRCLAACLSAASGSESDQVSHRWLFKSPAPHEPCVWSHHWATWD